MNLTNFYIEILKKFYKLNIFLLKQYNSEIVIWCKLNWTIENNKSKMAHVKKNVALSWILTILFRIKCYVFFQVVFISQCLDYRRLHYGNYEYPLWADIIGLTISLSSMIWVPLYAIYYVFSKEGNIWKVKTPFPIALIVFKCLHFCSLVYFFDLMKYIKDNFLSL